MIKAIRLTEWDRISILKLNHMINNEGISGKNQFGVVLSGGGLRGIAHLGFLSRLEELGISPSVISGTSIGALVGAFYLSGKTIDEILNFFHSTPLFQYSKINPRKAGIFDTEKYVTVLQEFLPGYFEDLDQELIVCAANAEEGCPRYFKSGELVRPILASCAVPLLFSPVRIEDKLFIDGGVLDNFPIEPVKKACKVVVGSYVGNPGQVEKKDLSSVLKLTSRANQLLLYASVKEKLMLADAVVDFPLHRYGRFSNKNIDEIFEFSCKWARDLIDDRKAGEIFADCEKAE